MLKPSLSDTAHLDQSRDFPSFCEYWCACSSYQQRSAGGPWSAHHTIPLPAVASTLKLINDEASPPELELQVAMSSSKSLRRKNLAFEIQRDGTEMAPCSKCRNAKVKPGEEKPKYIVGPQSERCSECVRKGQPHCDVTLSTPQWVKLRDARDALRRDIEKVEEEEVNLLQELTARRMKKLRLRKQLRFSEERTNAAVSKELEELDALDAAEQAFLPQEQELGVEIPENPFPFHGILEMPPTAWDDLWQPGPASADGTHQLVPSS